MPNSYYLNEVLHHEWLLTNDKGGYALGYGDLTNDRKYNGLLIASDATFARLHCVATQEELVEWRGNKLFLDSNGYANCIYPDGYQYIVKSWLRPYPTVLYSTNPVMDDIMIVKEILMHPTKNCTMVRFSNYGNHGLHFFIRPKFTLRDHHTLNSPGTWDRIQTTLKTEVHAAHFIREDSHKGVHTYIIDGVIEEERLVFREVYYCMEAARGYDATEDLISPFRIAFDVFPGKSQWILYSDEPVDAVQIIAEIEARYSMLPLPADHPVKTNIHIEKHLLASGEDLFSFEDYRTVLHAAMNDFIANDNIVAGFPWFGAWGRDTWISLGALLAMGKTDTALKMIDTYAARMENGCIPNVLGEGGEGENYDTVDASLWFVLRAYQVACAKDDAVLYKKIFNEILPVIVHYLKDPELPFHCDEDGLISIRSGPWALTWMDAKIFGNPITPRFGKCVEINALWYNAVSACITLAEKAGISSSEKIKQSRFTVCIAELKKVITKIEKSATAFITSQGLADRIEDGKVYDELRPNALIAVSLPFKLWGMDIVKRVWEYTRHELFTPYGIRTLSPAHSAFKKKYIGDQKMRDMAYHNGTVWAWLLAPFVHTYYDIFKTEKSSDELRDDIIFFIWSFRNGFMRGHIASVAEVWDGDIPHFPKGCPAQAWSVAALVEAEALIDAIKNAKG